MKRLIIAGALALAAVAASACSGCAILSNDRGILERTTADEKGLYAIEAAMYGADAAAGAAVDSGLLQPGSAQAVQIADWLDEAHKAVLAARAAYAVGDARTVAARISAAQGLIAQAWAVIPQKGP